MPLKVTDTPEYTEAWQVYCLAYKGTVSAKHVHAFAAGLQRYIELTTLSQLIEVANRTLPSHVVFSEEHLNATLCDNTKCPIHHPKNKSE